MSVLSVQDLRKTFGTRAVFDGVSFAVADREAVGFIGVNGSGKSTLFRIVAGLEGVNAGTIAVRRDASVGYLPQEPDLEGESSIHDAVAAGRPELLAALREHREIGESLGRPGADVQRLLARQARAVTHIDALGGWDWEHRVEAMLTRLGVQDWDRKVGRLSGGERKRVALARVLLAQPDILLLDEPTNHLDADTVAWLEEHLLEYPGSILLITHDRYFLDRVVDRMIEVTQGELISFPGGYTEYLQAKAERTERAAVEDEKRRKLMEKELAWVRRSPSARTGKQKARIGRLEALEAQQASLPRDPEVADIRSGSAPRLGRTVLELHGLSKGYGENVLIRDLSLLLRAGDRLGIIGPNGSGKTTLLKVILGEVEPDAGSVVLGQNTRIAYFDQDRGDLDPDATLYEAVASTEWVQLGGERVHVRSYLDRFLFAPERQQQKVRSLSGGERSRLLLARLFLEEANLLILDEPTNDLDLVTLRVLEEVLADWPGSVLMVTHDRFFLDRVATGLLVFEGEGVVHRHVGGYDLYRRQRAEKEAARRETVQPQRRTSTPAPATPRGAVPDGSRKLTWKERKELETLEEAIARAEADREALESRLADPGLYSGSPEEVGEVTDAYRSREASLETLYARWMELSERA
jgi:ABC transport system ATP-binding/permease protein